jgi:hypothetical protein
MRMTRMPGFSADASLHRSHANYQVDQLPGVLGRSGKEPVQPAAHCFCFPVERDQLMIDTYCCCSSSYFGFELCCNSRTGACGRFQDVGKTFRSKRV